MEGMRSCRGAEGRCVVSRLIWIVLVRGLHIPRLGGTERYMVAVRTPIHSTTPGSAPLLAHLFPIALRLQSIAHQSANEPKEKMRHTREKFFCNNGNLPVVVHLASKSRRKHPAQRADRVQEGEQPANKPRQKHPAQRADRVQEGWQPASKSRQKHQWEC